MIRYYKKKPVVVEAIQFHYGSRSECIKFIGKSFVKQQTDDNRILIQTLEGTLLASHGDFIIKGIEGEFYPCRSDIFTKTYEEVEK